MKDFKDKVAFVTGGASGIGLAIAEALAAEGARLALADVNTEALEAACADFRGRGVTASAWHLDVADRNTVYRVADEVEQEFGRIHLAFNNAGIAGNPLPIEETPDDDIDRMLGINLYGVLNGIKAFVPKILKHGEGGHVVNTASFLGIYLPPNQNRSLYSATKMGVIALSEGLRDSLASRNIGVSVLCPSPVRTNILNAAAGGSAAAGAAAEPAKISGVMPHDVGAAISAAEAARFVMRGIRDNQLYIITHPGQRQLFESRSAGFRKAFDYWDEFLADSEEGGSALG